MAAGATPNHAIERARFRAARPHAQVRRQFAERPGIMTYAEKPDYARCVAIVAAAALRAMVKPGVLAVGAPVAVGVVFRLLGAATGQPLLGARAVAAMLMFTTVAGARGGAAAALHCCSPGLLSCSVRNGCRLSSSGTFCRGCCSHCNSSTPYVIPRQAS